MSVPPLAAGLLKCPRCAGDLVAIEGHAVWRNHWRCDGCCLVWEFVRGRLVQGRSPKEHN